VNEYIPKKKKLISKIRKEKKKKKKIGVSGEKKTKGKNLDTDNADGARRFPCAAGSADPAAAEIVRRSEWANAPAG
jgi:hypothetical protein